MTIKKDDAINSITVDFEELANLVLLQLDLLESQLQTGGLEIKGEILSEVLKNEEKLDHHEVKLSDRIVNTIVLYQPLASEIRKIIACYRIVISLERIGDLVVTIFNSLQNIKNKELYSGLYDVIFNMLLFSTNMVKKALISFSNSDRELAIWCIKNESMSTEMNQKLLKKAIDKSNFSDDKKNVLISFVTIKEMISNIERISSHAANIAEAAIYSIEGKDVRHHKPEEVD